MAYADQNRERLAVSFYVRLASTPTFDLSSKHLTFIEAALNNLARHVQHTRQTTC